MEMLDMEKLLEVLIEKGDIKDIVGERLSIQFLLEKDLVRKVLGKEKLLEEVFKEFGNVNEIFEIFKEVIDRILLIDYIIEKE